MLNEEIKCLIREAYANLAKNIPGFKPRRGQGEMIAEIARTLDPNDTLDRRIAVIEGQTGTGKSIGYMLGAIPLAQHIEKRLIISTATVALQEQLIEKDLPLVADKAGLEFSYKIAKGRRRYVCTRNLNSLTGSDSNQDALDFGDDHLGVASWARQPTTEEVKLVQKMEKLLNSNEWAGDFDELADPVADDVKDMLTTSNAGCSGRACPKFHQCPFQHARQDLKKVDVIVTNHDFVLSDLEMGGGVLLPPPEECVYVFDEAHHLPDKAISHFAHLSRLKSSIKGIDSLAKNCNSAAVVLNDEKMKRKATGLRGQFAEIKQMLLAMEKQIVASFPEETAAASFAKKRKAKEVNWRFPHGKTPDTLRQPGQDIANNASKLLLAARDIHETLRKGITEKSVSNGAGANILQHLGQDIHRLDELTITWALWASPEKDQRIPMARWVNKSESGEYSVAVSAISASDMLRAMLWDKAYAAILTSATLTALNSFRRFQRSSGLHANDGTSYLRIASPFDYANVGVIEVPWLASEPNNTEKHTDEVTQYVSECMDHSKGNLVLFSSVWQMKKVAEQLPPHVARKCLLQGACTKSQILHQHKKAVKAGEGSTIFGLASFAEGVDLPGVLCSHVVIAKLPFAVPGTPVEEARSEYLEKNGMNPFMEITVPDASLKLVQAVGRLIRTEQDTGRVTILDKRLITKRYGSQLLDSLPPLKRCISEDNARKRA